MLLVQKCIQFLNPGQTPVIGADQPLYTFAKQTQRKFPAVLGEDKYVVLMGALHIEDKGETHAWQIYLGLRLGMGYVCSWSLYLW